MRILSILVNKDSFYYVVVNHNDGKYELMDIDYAYFDFISKHEESTNIPKTRAGLVLTEYAMQWNIDKIAISLADSFADFAKIPNIDGNSSEENEDLTKLYINQVYNSDDFDDFEIELIKYNLAPEKNLFLVSFIHANLYVDILKTFNLNNFPIIKSGTNFFNSIRAFEYNYHIIMDKNNLLISFNDNSIISSRFQNSLLSDFSIDSSDSNQEDSIRRLFEKYSQIDNVFLFGKNLNKSKLDFIQNNYQGKPVFRLGAFDNLTHRLDQRHLEFAGRMFHNYTGVIGAIISNPQTSINRFNK
ncbi:MAG: hypothetical protein WCR42_14405 [bacterium]